MGGGLTKEILETKHVVIIGGGYGGIHLAAQLKASGIPFKLIDPKEYFFHNVGALRAVVEPGEVDARILRKFWGQVSCFQDSSTK